MLSACSAATADEWKRAGLPAPASDRAESIETFWVWTWVAAMIVGIITWALILWAAAAYRRRNDALPPQTRYNMPIETLYTLLPLVVVGAFFYWTYETEVDVLAKSETPDVTIGVVGQQWSWTFNYLGATPEDTVYDIGTAAAAPTLYLPVDQSVRFQLNSPDVIHSFWVPNFLFKMDVVPGRTNEFELTPTVEGDFAGKCAELCGSYHSRMIFRVKVVDQAEYQQHLADLKTRGQTGEIKAPLKGAFSPTPLGDRPESEK